MAGSLLTSSVPTHHALGFSPVVSLSYLFFFPILNELHTGKDCKYTNGGQIYSCIVCTLHLLRLRVPHDLPPAAVSEVPSTNSLSTLISLFCHVSFLLSHVSVSCELGLSYLILLTYSYSLQYVQGKILAAVKAAHDWAPLAFRGVNAKRHAFGLGGMHKLGEELAVLVLGVRNMVI